MSGAARRIGLARSPGDALWKIAQNSGWEPTHWVVSALQPTGTPPPFTHPDAAILLSPAGARAAQLLGDIPCLATGEATGQALDERKVLLSPEPRAEGLWALLRERFPAGGDFLLVRGERSRGFLEEAAEGTPWRLHPWITHAERPVDPPPSTDGLDAVLALSPLQAELMAPLAGKLLRFAWGERAAAAFAAAGHPAHATCEPRPEDLGRILTSWI